MESINDAYATVDDIRAASCPTDCLDGKTCKAIEAARDRAVELVEHECRRSFVPREATATVQTNAYGFSELPWSDVTALSAEVDGQTVGVRLVGDCQCAFGAWLSCGQAQVTATYGLAKPPAQIREAVVQLALYFLRPDSRPSNATGQSTDFGFIRFSIAGRDGATGLIEVDAAISQWRRTGCICI